MDRLLPVEGLSEAVPGWGTRWRGMKSGSS